MLTFTRLRHLSLRSTLLRVGWNTARCWARISAQLPVPRTMTLSISSSVSSADHRVLCGFLQSPASRQAPIEHIANLILSFVSLDPRQQAQSGPAMLSDSAPD